MERTQIDALIERTDLVTLAEQAGGRFVRHGTNYRGACPLHGGRNTTGFSIFIGEDGRQAWKCFTDDCGGGDVLAFVMKWKGIRFPDAIRFLGGEPISPEQEAKLAIERAERAARMAEQAAAEARAAVAALKSTEVWIKYHDEMTDDARVMWTERGIPDAFQRYWELGFCKEKYYETKQGKLLSPSLTIPIFSYGWEVLNVKHRLLNPLDPNDKYRPEKFGLKMPPYICDPGMDKSKVENILIVEGEIKAMVSYIALDSGKWQVVGLPGKDAQKIKSGLVDEYKGRNCVVCLDPDGREQAEELARALGGRMFTMPRKIDDMINRGEITQQTLRGAILQSRKV